MFQALIDEVDLLKSGLESRNGESHKLVVAWTQSLYQKCELHNLVTIKEVTNKN